MLKTIYIQNYALIDELTIQFESGFSVITGETGAGKSIILGAITLLLGQKADTKAIQKGATKCIVEATFSIEGYGLQSFFDEHDIDYDETECIIRREISANGKSRAFINDTPASLALLKELGEKLIDIHSQHQNLLINKEGFQLNILDILAHNEAQLSHYKTVFNQYRQAIKQLAQVKEEAERSRQEEDYIRFQLQQLDEAQLHEGEQTQLEQEAETLIHAEDIKTSVYRVAELLNGDHDANVRQLIHDAAQQLQSTSRIYPPAAAWNDRLQSCLIEIKDLAHELERVQDEIEFNPSRLEFVNERLNLIYTLQQKHNVDSIKALIQLCEHYRRQLDTISSADHRITALSREAEALYAEVVKLGAELTAQRKQAALTIQSAMQKYLIPLGMPNVRFEVEITERSEHDINGKDTVNFLFSANKNGRLQNVASIASGGEIARVMLSLKAMIAGAVKLPTIIFDEIDTGVSGSIAEKMALIMQEMGAHNRQVISITHLPQIAARGKVHYKVYKQDTETTTVSHIRRLDHNERIHELANMLSGSTLTEAAINNAKALLDHP